LGHTQRIFDADYADLLASRADEANLWHADALINTRIADLFLLWDVT
jgi:hypothetical protein